MRDWQGIRQDTAWTENDGAFMAVNLEYEIDGEIRRRPGLEAFTQQSGTAMSCFWVPTTGYQIAFATSDGEVYALELT